MGKKKLFLWLAPGAGALAGNLVRHEAFEFTRPEGGDRLCTRTVTNSEQRISILYNHTEPSLKLLKVIKK